MFCIKCGNKISETDKFCQNCGEKADSADQSQSSHQTDFGTSKRSKKFRKDIWKPALIIIVVVGLLVWAGIASENESSSNSDLVNVDNYLCSEYHADKADSLRPIPNFDDELTQIEIMESEVHSLENELNNMYVDEYSQESIDNYNSKFDVYENKYDIYKAKHDNVTSKINNAYGSVDEYNRQVDVYNNYLETNCDK